ncbi:MAG: hypothetical protein ABJ308_04235 [Halieaceae bacterium]
MENEFLLKAGLIAVLLVILPIMSYVYFIYRTKQRRYELARIFEKLNIADSKRPIFEPDTRATHFFTAVGLATAIAAIGFVILLFGHEMQIADDPNMLWSGPRFYSAMQPDPVEGKEVKEVKEDKAQEKTDARVDADTRYRRGAAVTFGMAFLGAYLWGLQNIARRYSMNDIIPATYYNLSIRMIMAAFLALVVYHIADILPPIFASLSGAEGGGSAESSPHKLMPAIGFLIGMFPQRGLHWLRSRFSVFAREENPTVRDLPLEMIEGITMYDVVRLQELGMDTCYELANADYIPLMCKTPYGARQLLDWMLQAKLCVYFADGVKDLREHGIRTVVELTTLSEDELEALAKDSQLRLSVLESVSKRLKGSTDMERLLAAERNLSRFWDHAPAAQDSNG